MSAEETKQYPTYTYAQRVAGAEKLITELTETGIKAELQAEESENDPKYDKVRIQVSDKAGVPAAYIGIDRKGFVNLQFRFTTGDQKVVGRALILLSGVIGRDVSEKFTKTVTDPSKAVSGGSFLDRLDQPNA